MAKPKNSDLDLELGILFFILTLTNPQRMFQFPNKDWVSPKILHTFYRYVGLKNEPKLNRNLNEKFEELITDKVVNCHTEENFWGNESSYWRGEEFFNRLERLAAKQPNNDICTVFKAEIIMRRRMASFRPNEVANLINIKNEVDKSTNKDVHNHDLCIMMRSVNEDFIRQPLLEEKNSMHSLVDMLISVAVRIDKIGILSEIKLNKILLGEGLIASQLNGLIKNFHMPLPDVQQEETLEYKPPDINLNANGDHPLLTLAEMLAHISQKVDCLAEYIEKIWEKTNQTVVVSAAKVKKLADLPKKIDQDTTDENERLKNLELKYQDLLTRHKLVFKEKKRLEEENFWLKEKLKGTGDNQDVNFLIHKDSSNDCPELVVEEQNFKPDGIN